MTTLGICPIIRRNMVFGPALQAAGGPRRTISLTGAHEPAAPTKIYKPVLVRQHHPLYAACGILDAGREFDLPTATNPYDKNRR